MKKILALVLALVMVAAMLCCVLASCGSTLKGTYSAEVLGTGVEMTFEGKNVTITLKALGMEVGSSTGTYKIADDKITLTFEGDNDKVNAYNGNEANKDKQIKLGNLGSGEYVGKGKYDALNDLLTGKQTELDTANGLIAELKKGTKGNEELQGKINGYETQVADLQKQLAEIKEDL